MTRVELVAQLARHISELNKVLLELTDPATTAERVDKILAVFSVDYLAPKERN